MRGESHELFDLIRYHSYHSSVLFGATGGTMGGRAAAAGGTCGAFELPSNGKREGRHNPLNFFAHTFRAGNLFRTVED